MAKEATPSSTSATIFSSTALPPHSPSNSVLRYEIPLNPVSVTRLLAKTMDLEEAIRGGGEGEEEAAAADAAGGGGGEGEDGQVAAAVEEEEEELQRGSLVGGGDGSEHAARGVKRTRRDRGSTAKERISKMPPCAAGKRSSIYRGVTRHRWTGRYEAHLWDKSTWNQNQNKKGKQVYLGAYDEEEAAARAYDLAALKYWGPGTLINFPVSDYARDIEEMQNISREDYLASLRRKSSGFSRGLSKFRGIPRHHQNARWDAQIGRVLNNNLPHLGSYGTFEEGVAGPGTTMEYRGIGCITTFNLSNLINWLQPGKPMVSSMDVPEVQLPKSLEEAQSSEEQQPILEEDSQAQVLPWQCCEPYQLPSLGLCSGRRSASSPTALGLLFQSPMFKKMLERVSTSNANAQTTPTALESTYKIVRASAQTASTSVDNTYNFPNPNAQTTCTALDNTYSIANASAQITSTALDNTFSIANPPAQTTHTALDNTYSIANGSTLTTPTVVDNTYNITNSTAQMAPSSLDNAYNIVTGLKSAEEQHLSKPERNFNVDPECNTGLLHKGNFGANGDSVVQSIGGVSADQRPSLWNPFETLTPSLCPPL